MKRPVFTGACTALITPMSGGKIDYKSFDRLIEDQIASGISAVVVAGTTGESAVLSYREHRNLIRHAALRINGRIPLIAGAGSNDTEKAVRITKYACASGADAILSVTPYYNKTNQNGLTAHFEAVACASEKPVIVYNVPGRTNVNILPETYRRLAEIDGICGIKEASTNLSDAALTAAICPELALYCGNDDLLFPMLSVGACGVISVMSNIFPAVSVKICRLYAEGNHAGARTLYRQTLSFARLLFCDVNPIPIKFVMAHAGLCSPEIRLPLLAPSASDAARLTEAYERLRAFRDSPVD